MNESARILTAKSMDGTSSSVLGRLFDRLPTQGLAGHYVSEDQTWSHRDANVFSPVKVNQEM